MAMTQPTIFITIPAYEDPQLLSTIEKALENALSPERLFFCIGMQYKELPDISKYSNNPNFKFMFYDVDQRPGVYYIRREMANQYSGQDYFLMIDSHMTFSKYWDALVINDYINITKHFGPKTVLSKPCSESIGPTFDNGNINDQPHWKVDYENDVYDIQRTIIPWVTPVVWNGDPFIKSYYVCSHFFFTSGNFIGEVGFHEGIRTYCEELTISLTTFLAGWDTYMNPTHNHIAHTPQETTRALYSVDNFTIAEGKQYTAIQDSDYVKTEIARFVLTGESDIVKMNAVRTADEYYRLAGISDAQMFLKRVILEDS